MLDGLSSSLVENVARFALKITARFRAGIRDTLPTARSANLMISLLPSPMIASAALATAWT
jgi:hypothetical protein